MERKNTSSLSCMVRTRTLMASFWLRICRVASMPSSWGMVMSISTTSGARVSAVCTAARPSSTSPTTSRSGSPSRRERTPSRNIAWSSTSSTRMRSPTPGHRGLGGLGEGDVGAHPGPSAGAAGHADVAAGDAGALAHPGDAEPRPPVAVRSVEVEADPVVADVEPHRPGEEAQPEADPAGAAVLLDVGERLLGDPVEGHLDGGGEPAAPSLGVDARLELRIGGAVADVPGERREQPELVERRRAQLGGDP